VPTKKKKRSPREPKDLVEDFKDLSRQPFAILPYKVGKLDRFVPKTSTQHVKPNKTASWYISGPEGTRWNCKLTFLKNTGGHQHSGNTSDPKVVGKISPSSGVLGKNHTKVIYKATNFCGRIQLTTKFGGKNVDVDYNDVRFEGLSRLKSHKNLMPYTNDKTHPDGHYGIKKLLAAMQKLGNAFGRKFKKKKLWVNDMSLPWGGVFDSRPTSHKGHKWGGEVDISYLKQTKEEKEWFKKNAKKYFTRVTLHGNPKHWHCSIFKK
jgi:penicillin-insensitive murein endopeptidase